MKKGKVYLHDCYAGLLTEDENGFTFVYDPSFLQSDRAEAAKIAVVPHGLIRFADGEQCYITRRIDRLPDGQKVPMEDMCQLTERLIEYKYKGSYEQIAKAIKKYSSAPQLDLVNFWELVVFSVFSWITGNSDMHLKNSAAPSFYGWN